MNWTPEIFAGFVTAGGVGLVVLKKVGIDIPWTRNSKPKDSPKSYDSAIDVLEEKATEARVKIGEHEKRLDKHDISFEKMFTRVANTDTNVGKLLERTDTILRMMK